MTQTTDDEFFETRQDWSRRKHLILGYYLVPATAKLRSVSPDRRVIIVDGFAGRGVYEDGSPGSPVHVGHLADTVRSWKDPVSLRVHNIEPVHESHDELAKATDTWVKLGVITNHHATFTDALPSVLKDAGNSPLFAFLDPFRPKHLSLTDMAPLIARPSITELLIVFHTPKVLRIIEQVRPEANTPDKTRAGSMLRLDAIFGGDRWRRFLTEQPTPDAIIQCFMEELAERWRIANRNLFICSTPIEAKHGINLKYHIIFTTRHMDGVFLINDAFAKEKRDIHHRSTSHAEPSLDFEEFADPLDDVNIPARVRKLVFDAASTNPAITWSYQRLVYESMRSSFGQYSETEYTRAIRSLLEVESRPRIVGVDGDTLKSGKWKVDKKLKLRMET